MQGTENTGSRQGESYYPKMKYRGEFEKNKTCRWWYNRVKRAVRNMGRSVLRNKEEGREID
jgi:uncharacterized protein (UPF0333 family)